MSSSPPVDRPSRRWQTVLSWLPVVLLVLHIGLALESVRHKSLTYDEVAYITAGTSYWLRNDYRLNPENGNLPQRVYGLAALAVGAKFPAPDRDWNYAEIWKLGPSFIYDQGNDSRRLIFAGRVSAMIFSVGLCLVVWCWSREIFGAAGGLLSLALCAGSPTLLAHGPLMTADVCLTFFFTLSMWRVWRTLQVLSWINVLACSLSIAGLFLSKTSAVIILPCAAMLVGIRLWTGQPLAVQLPRRGQFQIHSKWKQLSCWAGVFVVSGCVAWSAVWGAYGFRYRAAPEGVEYRYLKPETLAEDLATLAGKSPSAAAMLREMARVRFLPEPYLYGASFVANNATRPAYFAGELSDRGWWTFFPVVVAIKSTLPLMGLTLLGCWAVIRDRTRPAATGTESLLLAAMPLLVIWICIWPLLMGSTLNIGQRHAFPVYPPAYILSGAAICLWPGASLVLRLVLAVCCAGIGLAICRTHPDYLSYFNLFVRRDRAYRIVTDSSLDWGQDLPALSDWLKTTVPRGTPVYLSYFGVDLPVAYGIEAIGIPVGIRADPQFMAQLRGGWFCISATSLQGAYHPNSPRWTEETERDYREIGEGFRALRATMPPEQILAVVQDPEHPLGQLFMRRQLLAAGRLMAYLRQREPDAHVGYSILLFRLSDVAVNEAIYGPPPLEDDARRDK